MMNQEQRNADIQRARSELTAGRPVTAKWLTPHSGGHVTRVVLTEGHHWHQFLVPLDAVSFEFEAPVVVVKPVPTERVLTAGDAAIAFLRSVLAEGPIPTLRLEERAEAAGHSWSTIRRLRHKAGAEVFKDGPGAWCWRLKEDD
jgi:hypothetical protein